MDPVDRVAEEVLVRHRDDRHGHARQAADLGRVHAAGVDDDLGGDRVALARVLDGDAGHPSTLDVDPDDAMVLADVDARRRARRPRSASASPDGSSQPSVGSQAAPWTPSVDISGNRSRASCGPDELERQPERARPPGLSAELLHPLGRRGDAQRADLAPARVGAGLGREAPVELDPVDHHPRQRHRRAQLPDEARGMERRAGRQLRAIEQDDVTPAPCGEVVRDRRAADAAADDDRARVLHLPSHPRRRSAHGRRRPGQPDRVIEGRRRSRQRASARSGGQHRRRSRCRGR